ncbi:MFS transporter [Solimonas marina]|uniref:MFS transporter n=1 Tax=Solimonas marina TaxID=2714601 RepID=A0A970B783_9GAMM|nr:MFS transporter [Solimonas marina]NKF20949.1 MFS transporter [Solimonas marina]
MALPASTSRIPTGVWVLGFVSLLMDVSSELIHSLLPVFLVGTLGASALTFGLIEGAGEATAMIVKIFSGAFSDWLGRRKSLAVIGYGLGALSKPLFALASSAGWVLTARLVDRVGKGIRGAPRDAMVAELTPPAMRGAAFGLRQTLDTVGAFAGPLLGVVLMLAWSGDIRSVFGVAIVPGLLAVLLLGFGLREPPAAGGPARVNPLRGASLRQFGVAYWSIVAIGAVFTLARFSEGFLVLRLSKDGMMTAQVPLVLVAMNAAYMLSAYPFGKLSDRGHHGTLLAAGIAVLIAADLLLASGGRARLWIGVLLWGLHMGMTQGLFARLVADAAPPALRGTAFGFFNLAAGIATLIASLVAGLLWDLLGPRDTFVAGAVFSAAALLALALRPRARAVGTS